MISNTLPQSLIDNPLLSQWIGFEAARPRPYRHRQGGDRARHPDRAHPDRRRRARRRARAGTDRVGPDRCQPGRGLHLGQLFDRGGRRLDPPGLRRGARAVPRPPCRVLRCPVAELSVEDGQFLRTGKATGRDYWSIAGEVVLERRASGTAPTKLPSTYRIVGRNLPRIDLPAKLAGAAFIHDITPDDMSCMRACCGGLGAAPDWSRSTRTPCAAPPRRRSTSYARATSSPSRRRARPRYARGRSGPHCTRAGTAASRPQPTSASRTGSRRSPRATARSRPGLPAAPPRDARVEARYSRPFLTYASIGPSCALAELKDGALKVWSHCQGPAVLRDWLARALGLPTSQVTVFHRQGAGAYGHNTADDAAVRCRLHRHPHARPHRAGAMVARGRVPVRADQHRHGDRASRRARHRQPAGRLDHRDLERAARPASGHERQLQPDWRRGAAQRAGAQRAQRRSGRARRRRDPQRPRHLRPATAPADPSSAAATAVADLLAARARRLGQCVRDRSLHRRAGGDRRRRPGHLPAVAPLRPARAPRGRDRRRR